MPQLLEQTGKNEYILHRKEAELPEYPITKDFNEALQKFPHLREYVNRIAATLGMPEWRTELSRELRDIEYPNIIYPVGDPIFIHIYRRPGESMRYYAIEPSLTSREKELLDKIQSKIVKYAVELEDLNVQEIYEQLIKLYDRVVTIGRKSLFSDKIVLKDEFQYRKLRYFLIRERLGYGKLEPLLRDPYLEDIHILGVGPVWVVHKIWKMLKTNIEFKDEIELNKYILRVSEIVERPVSEARPIVDAILPDGSRVNFIYGKDISLRGSSFTIRKFSKKPISITQLIAWNTMSAEEAAYLWLAIEHGMNIFVSGETASGKTTTLNAITVFIRPDWKVYSVEDTPELNIPHPVWQRLVTRQTGKTTDVEMYDLLKAALRSRPNYILVGEIRGKEGYVAFQAMQCAKEAQVIMGDDVKSISELFKEYKSKFGSKVIDGKEIVEIKENLEIPAYDSDKGLTKAKVKAILKMPKSKLIRVILEDGNVFEVTPNHKFITNFGELTAEEMLKSFNAGIAVYVKRIKNFEKKKKLNIKFKKETFNLSNPWLWYGIGRLLGDDSLFIYYKENKIKGFVWQAKTTYEDEVKWLEIMDKVLPNKSKNASIIKEGNAYRKRIYLKWWFVDWLIKKGFIEIPQRINKYSQAVIKHVGKVPEKALGPFLAGLFDSDGSISWVDKKTLLFRFALDFNRKNREFPLAMEQIKFFKKLEGKLPKILQVVIRYSSNCKETVEKYVKEIEKFGIKVKLEKYDKQNGIGGYVIFSAKKEELVWFAKNVVPYMLRKDKKEAISRKIHIEIKSKEKLNIDDKIIYYIEVESEKFDKLLKELWLSGYNISSDLIMDNRKRIIYLDDSTYAKVVKVEVSDEDYTYDLLLEGAKYYIGFNGGGAIAVEDTGHPVMSTFHSGSLAQLIERLTGEPINIPITFIDNLNIVVFQGTVYIKGNMERRVLNIYEIERYLPELGRIAARNVFVWDRLRDKHIFRGKYNSYILERKIAPMLRLKNPKKIYDILELRARILKRMVEEEIFDFYEVWEVIKRFYEYGIAGLPFSL